jgi:hypothetical protein
MAQASVIIVMAQASIMLEVLPTDVRPVSNISENASDVMDLVINSQNTSNNRYNMECK